MVWGEHSLKKLSSLNGLRVMMFWRFGGKGLLTESLNESSNDEAVCRTAPATPGLLNISRSIGMYTV